MTSKDTVCTFSVVPSFGLEGGSFKSGGEGGPNFLFFEGDGGGSCGGDDAGGVVNVVGGVLN